MHPPINQWIRQVEREQRRAHLMHDVCLIVGACLFLLFAILFKP